MSVSFKHTFRAFFTEKRIGLLFLACVLLVLVLRAFSLDLKSSLVYATLVGAFGFLALSVRGYHQVYSTRDLPLAVFLFVVALSYQFTQHPYGFSEFAMFFAGAMVFFLVSRSPRIQLKPYMLMLVGLLTLSSVLGLFAFIFGPVDRMPGFFFGDFDFSFYPNAAAHLALLILPVNGFFFHRNHSENTKLRWALFAALLVNLTAFWLTYSRAAFLIFLGLSSLTALYILFSKSKELLSKDFLLPLLAAFLSLPLAFMLTGFSGDGAIQGTMERIAFQDIPSQDAVSERIDFWFGSLAMTLDYPLFGVGPGGFEHVYPRYQTELLAKVYF